MIGSSHLRHRLQVDRLSDSDAIFGDLTIRDQPWRFWFPGGRIALSQDTHLGRSKRLLDHHVSPLKAFVVDPTSSSFLLHDIFHGIFMVICWDFTVITGQFNENTLDINGHWMGFHGDFGIEKSYRVIILGWSPPSASMNHGLGPHGHGHGIGQLVATSPMSLIMCLSRKFQKDHPRQTPQKKNKSTVNIWLMIVNTHLVGGWPTPLKWWS